MTFPMIFLNLWIWPRLTHAKQLDWRKYSLVLEPTVMNSLLRDGKTMEGSNWNLNGNDPVLEYMRS